VAGRPDEGEHNALRSSEAIVGLFAPTPTPRRFTPRLADPAASLAEINRRFAAVPFEGAYWASLKASQ
jgi:hypothetical protein